MPTDEKMFRKVEAWCVMYHGVVSECDDMEPHVESKAVCVYTDREVVEAARARLAKLARADGWYTVDEVALFLPEEERPRLKRTCTVKSRRHVDAPFRFGAVEMTLSCGHWMYVPNACDEWVVCCPLCGAEVVGEVEPDAGDGRKGGL